MFSCKTTGDQNEGTHPELLLMLKPASQCHKHDCIKHAPLITLSKVLGFFRKTESKCAICATLLLEMWWKRQWKGKKKKSSECCYRCPSGPPEPSLLPPANSSNHLTVLSAVQRHRLCCTGKWQKCKIFSFEGWFQSSVSEETAPQPQAVEDSWFLHTSSTINNGQTLNPKLRWLRYDCRYDW